MNNKIVLSLLIICILISVTGCGKSASNNDSFTVESNNKKVSTEFKFDNKTFNFNKDASFKGVKFKYDENLKKTEETKSVSLKYGENLKNVGYAFWVSITVYENRTKDDIFGMPKEGEYEIKKVNNISWMNYTKKVDWTTTIVYAIEKNNNVYIINVIKNNETDVDVDQLAEVFINSVTID